MKCYLASEAHIARDKYNGESKLWNFDSYAAVNLDQHQILSDLVKHSYQRIDEGTKSWHLNFGIKTDALNIIKANILATPALQRYFDRCVTLFKSYISSNQTAKDININISETNTDHEPDRNKGRGGGGGGRGRGRRRGRYGGHRGSNRDGVKPKKGNDGKAKRDGNNSNGYDVSYRYHTSAEYATLSTNQRNQLREYCESEDKKRINAMKAMQVQISLLESKLEATKTGGGKPNNKTNVKNRLPMVSGGKLLPYKILIPNDTHLPVCKLFGFPTVIYLPWQYTLGT